MKNLFYFILLEKMSRHFLCFPDFIIYILYNYNYFMTHHIIYTKEMNHIYDS